MIKKEQYTELGNAKRFVRITNSEYKWVPEIKAWYRWNGLLWEEDKEEAVMREIEFVLESISDEVVELTKERDDLEGDSDVEVKGSKTNMTAKRLDNDIKEANQWYLRSQSGKSIREMVALAKTQKDMTKSIVEFDSKGHFIGCKNGVVDLRDGSLIEGDSAYLITKSTDVKYKEGAGCEVWKEQLLKYMSGNNEYVKFLQVLLGSSMVGHKSKWFTMFYGEKGGNGKSTIVDTVSNILNDYAKVGEPKVLLGGKSNSEYYLAAFKDTRFLIFNESDKEEVQMSEHLIKMVTDSGEVSARHPAGRPFEYQPVFTPVFCVNHLPTVSMDPAVWRRLLIMPFNYQVPVADQDSGFVDKLVKAEGAGILNWLIEGARQFLVGGLNPPVSLKAETLELRQAGDTLTQFIDEKCTVTDNGNDNVNLNDLRKLYIVWLMDNGYKKSPAAQRFARDMRDCGFDVRKGKGNVNYVYGLKDIKHYFTVSGNPKPGVSVVKEVVDEIWS